ncbi:MAG: response regulator [Myxococcota bacterium]|nr:response regulator [Myxococcota bacterium]
MSRATRGLRVLIVEDSVDLRELYAAWLRDRGYEVFEAGDGRSGWDRIAELQPDVVLLDLGLPSVDGWKLATLLRLDRRRCAPAVIAITGMIEPDAIQNARDAGVDAVLFKPCDADEIVDAIETEAARLNLG